ncbi:MAG: hypothetical protein ABIP21_01720, partial [Acidimicrobiia bacterium]
MLTRITGDRGETMVGTTLRTAALPRLAPDVLPGRVVARVRPRPSAAFGIAVLLMLIAGCVAVLSQLSISRHASSTPVQLRAPAATGRAIRLATPAAVTPGREVRLEVTGAKPGEKLVFSITSTAGTYVGPPHRANARGTVSTTYRPS